MEPMKSLSAAVCAVMGEVASLAKDGTNAFQNYSYTTESMVTNTLRPLMVKNGLSLMPHNVSETGSGFVEGKAGRMRHVSISATYLLLHTSGESLTITVPGEGMDSLDKSTAKALTACYKYALLQLFCVGRGEDGDEGKGYEGRVMASDASGKVTISENAAVRAAAAESASKAKDNAYVFTFGKHKDKPITAVDRDYLDWLVGETEAQMKDPAKANFQLKNKKMLDIILTEFSRRAQNAAPYTPDDDEIPF